jgi:hypothetical protein
MLWYEVSGSGSRIVSVGDAPIEKCRGETRELGLLSATTGHIAPREAWEAFILYCVHRAKHEEGRSRIPIDRVEVTVRELSPIARSHLREAVERRNRDLLPQVALVEDM